MRKRIVGALVVALACMGAAQAADGFFNDGTSLDHVYASHWQGAAITGPYLSHGGTALSIDIPYNVTGYTFFQFHTALDPAPINDPYDISDGEINVSLKFDYTGTETPPVGDMVFWLRAYAGRVENGQWVMTGRKSWFCTAPIDGDFNVNTHCVGTPGEPANLYNGATSYDHTSIYMFRMDVVYWEPTYTSNTISVDFIEFTKGEPPPVAVAGPDQTIQGVCGALTPVTLDGSGTIGAEPTTEYLWYDVANTLVGSGAIVNIDLPMGVHVFKLKVGEGCSWSEDTVIINVQGNQVVFPLTYSMAQQINHYDPLDPSWNVIYEGTNSLPMEIPAFDSGSYWPAGPFTRVWPRGVNWYYGPFIDLTKDCYAPVDLSSPGARLEFTARYFQYPDDYAGVFDGTNAGEWGAYVAYQDAPIFPRLWDMYGKRMSLGIVYGPALVHADPYFPPWETFEVPLISDGSNLSDADFDITKVVRIEFFGTNWAGAGLDCVEFKNVTLKMVETVVCGDTNCDGVVDTADIDNFVYVVVNGAPAPGCPTSLQAADTNGDGVVDTADIDSFVAAVVGGGCQ